MQIRRILTERRQRLLHKAPQCCFVLFFYFQRRLVAQHMQHPFRVVQEVGLTGNRLFRDNYAKNGVIIRRTQLKLRPARTGGNFSATQTLGADKPLFAARSRNTKPE